jgi:hypothetical protein
MKFHGIQMQGKYISEVVSNVAGCGAAGTKGRVVYVEGENSLYIDTGTEWRRQGIAPELFENYSILSSVTAHSPSATTITEQTVVGRLTGGTIKSLSTAELTTLIEAASVSLKGAAVLASSVEVIAGSDNSKVITPSTLTDKIASASEVITGTSITKLLTPASLTSKIDIDGTLAGNLDTRIPSQKATKTYVDSLRTFATAIIPAGTPMYFYTNTAPTGWTIDAAVADVCLAVKGGSNAYNTVGGSLAGTWTQPNHSHTGPSHTHTGPSHTHTTGSHALSVAEMPSHAHVISGVFGYPGSWSGVAGSPGSIVTAELGASIGSTYVGGNTSHNHGATAASGTANTGAEGTGATSASATANTYRPYAAIGIIATKN